MELEAITIQTQTPSREDEDETVPEPNDPLESFMPYEPYVDEEGNESEEPAEETPAEPMEETREDEIVVEGGNDEVAQQDSLRERDSSLSSAPGSEADDAQVSRPCNCYSEPPR